MPGESSRPLLTVAVASHGCRDARPFIEALHDAGLADNHEVEIRLSGVPALRPRDTGLPGNFYFHECPEGSSVFRQWGDAVLAGSGHWIATLDACCPPRKDWWPAVRNAIEQERPLFFGSVDAPGARGSTLAWLTEYAQFSDPIRTAPHDVPGINIALRRDLLPPTEELRRDGFVKILTLWRLDRCQGLRAQTIDGMRVRYQRPWSYPGYLEFRFRHGRHFGMHRHAAADQPPRWLCIAGSPLLPPLGLWRIWRQARLHAGVQVKFFSHLPALLLSETAWALGEFVGYLSPRRN